MEDIPQKVSRTRWDVSDQTRLKSKQRRNTRRAGATLKGTKTTSASITAAPDIAGRKKIFVVKFCVSARQRHKQQDSSVIRRRTAHKTTNKVVD